MVHVHNKKPKNGVPVSTWGPTSETVDQYWYDKLVKCSCCRVKATHFVSRGELQTKMCEEHALAMLENFGCSLRLIGE